MWELEVQEMGYLQDHGQAKAATLLKVYPSINDGSCKLEVSPRFAGSWADGDSLQLSSPLLLV